jgi:hypothetical protein
MFQRFMAVGGEVAERFKDSLKRSDYVAKLGWTLSF